MMNVSDVVMFDISQSMLTALGLVLSFISTCFSAWIAMRQGQASRRTDELQKETQKNTEITKMTHNSTNSKMDLLLKLTSSAAEARGVMAGRAELLSEQETKKNQEATGEGTQQGAGKPAEQPRTGWPLG